jgi:hypothetical protein
VRVSGNNKMRQKLYRHHTQYPGGLKEVSLEKMMATHPTRVIEHAVRGMLPHNRLGAKLRRHLKVYVGPEHPHHAQTGGAPKKPKTAVKKAAAEAKPEVVVEETPEVAAEEPAEEAVESVAEATPESVAEETPEIAAEEPAVEAVESVAEATPESVAEEPEGVAEASSEVAPEPEAQEESST